MTWWAWYTAGIITGWISSPITWLFMGGVALLMLLEWERSKK